MHKIFTRFIESDEEIVELNLIRLIDLTLKKLNKEVIYSDTERRFYLYQDGFWQQATKEYIISIFWTAYNNLIFPELKEKNREYQNALYEATSFADKKEISKYKKLIKRMENFLGLTQKRVNNYVESLSMCCNRIPDSNFSKIPLKNGYIDIDDDFSFKKINPYIYNRYVLDFNYVEKVEKPKIFFKFLEQIIPGENEREFLLNWLAHMLIIGNHRQKALFLYGSGRNGKGVLSRILHRLLGTQNCSTLTVRQLSGEKYFLGQLNNKLANICPDSDDKDTIDIGAFKTLTGNDTITVRDIYNAPFSMVYNGKLIYSINKVPYFSSKDVAIMERVEILNFPVTIREEDRIPNLEEIILEKEGDLIFNFLLKRLKNLKKIDFKFKAPPEIKNFTSEIMDQQDNISMFMQEYLLNNTDEIKWDVKLTTFYADYKRYAEDGGFKIQNRTTFKDNVQKWADRRNDIKISYRHNGKNYVFEFARLQTNIPLVIENSDGSLLQQKTLFANVKLEEIPY